MDWKNILIRLSEERKAKLEPGEQEAFTIIGVEQSIESSLIEGGSHASTLLNSEDKNTLEGKVKLIIKRYLPDFEFDEGDNNKSTEIKG